MRYLESIEKTAASRPDAVAVRTSEGASLTYRELWRRSEALAAHLACRDAAGIPVMVYGNKDPLMVVAFLACMKSGRAYIPLDCFSVPAERVASIAGQVVTATEGSAATPVALLAIDPLPANLELPGVEMLAHGEIEHIATGEGMSDRESWIAGEDLAYILFTSGSTGAPKGVEVTAACFDNFCSWVLGLAAGAADAVWVDHAPFSFDLSVFELAGALAAGGELFCLTHATQRDIATLFSALARSGAAIWVSTPSFAEMCLASREFSAELLPDLRLFLFCGETLPNATAARLLERFPQARVLNTYGPTESTVAVTSVEVTPAMAAASEPLPVGAPRSGTRIRIVAADGADCAPGELGEVVIEGDTVARGYFGRCDLTARVFGEARLGGAEVRSYRTGDEGYVDERGMLHYRGRLDLQVKLNGFRIELGEIEEHLRRLPDVAAACVVPAVREGRIAHLVAYVVPGVPLEDTPFRAGLAIKEQLKDALPHYMVPKKIAFCEGLPMTGNGKVDRRALAAACAR